MRKLFFLAAILVLPLLLGVDYPEDKSQKISPDNTASEQVTVQSNKKVLKQKQKNSIAQQSQLEEIANAYAQTMGYDLKEYQLLCIESSIQDQTWSEESNLFYLGTDPSADSYGKHFTVTVNAKTGEATKLTPEQ